MKYPEFKNLTVKGIAVVISEVNQALMRVSGDHVTDQKLLQAQSHLTIARSLLNEHMIENGNKHFTGADHHED